MIYLRFILTSLILTMILDFPAFSLDAGGYIVKAQQELSENSFDKAIASLEEALKISPNNLLALQGRGLAFLQKGENEKSINDFSTLIRLQPKDPNKTYDVASFAYNNRGIAYLNSKNYSLAISDFNQSIGLSKSNSWPYFNKGLAHMRAGDYRNAVVDFKHAIELSPKFVKAYIGRCKSYRQLGEQDKAANDCAEANRLFPEAEQQIATRGLQPEINTFGYQINGGTNELRKKNDNTKGAVNNWSDIRLNFVNCWTVPNDTEGSRISFLFLLSADGGLRGPPRVLGKILGGDGDAQKRFTDAAYAALDRCLPFQLTDSFRKVLGETPLLLSFVNNHPGPSPNFGSKMTIHASETRRE